MLEAENEFANSDEKFEIMYPKGAYVRLDIWKDEKGRKHGAWSLDDKMGWCWYGEDDMFLLGLLRVNSVIPYMRETLNTKFSKDDIAEAIRTSLSLNPTDGLYHILGDNAYFMQDIEFDESAEAEYWEQDWRDYLAENLGIPEHKAKEIAEEIVDDMWIHYSLKDDDMEAELMEDASAIYDDARRGQKWKDYVLEKVRKCEDVTTTTTEFMECVNDSLDTNPNIDESRWYALDEFRRELINKAITKAFCEMGLNEWEKYEKEYAERFNLKQDDLKKIRERLLDFCELG